MCRFLLIKSKKPIKPDRLLSDFSLMCKNSSQWQGDGFGIAFKIQNSKFKIQKSLKPIWEQIDIIKKIPDASLIVVHARGASFPSQKGNIDFNQPYIDDDLCFVFNGELYGVKIKIEGKIGAQKIFNLLRREFKFGEQTVLKKVQSLLRKNSKKILGMNIGLVYKNQISVLCDYDQQPDYYTLRYYISKDLIMICSEEIGDYKWKKMKKGEVYDLG